MVTKNSTEALVWSTEKRRVCDLIPLSFNPRKLTDRQRKDLELSLTKFNLVEIPAINLNNSILAGHQRLGILVALGRSEEVIDVRVPNRLLSDAEVKEYNVRSNLNTAEWDVERLRENFDVNDLLNWGFTQESFNDLGLELPTFQPVSLDEQSLL